MRMLPRGGRGCGAPADSGDARQVAGAGAAHTPGFVTVTPRAPIFCGVGGIAPVSVIAVPAAETVGPLTTVTSPAGPPKVTTAPGTNRVPPSVSGWTTPPGCVETT